MNNELFVAVEVKKLDKHDRAPYSPENFEVFCRQILTMRSNRFEEIAVNFFLDSIDWKKCFEIFQTLPTEK